MLRLGFELARRGYGRYAAYPGATWAGVFTNTFFGFLIAYTLLAVFEQRDAVGDYDARDAVTYTWLAQGMLMTIYLWGWFEVALRVRSGDVATDLQRPLDFQGYWLAQDLGRAAYHALFRGVPPFVLGALVFDVLVPGNPLVWLAFLASMTLAVVTSFAFRFLFNLAAFWLLDYRGAGVLAMVASTFFSGQIVPIAFFPHWLAVLAWALPFAAMVQAPIEIWLGHAEGLELLGLIALQAFWAGALLLVGRAVLAAGMRKLVIQGG
ncbi:MAG TPA: ABC-2 family transporter protein [Acidimicrobiia bacterium]|nr:ABC-2 family transporter protein [Acidimicrobiia bacterium]